jgi:hypothetical protein
MIINMESRRQFLRKIIMMFSALSLGSDVRAQKSPSKRQGDNVACNLYRAINNGSPADNLSKVIDMMGGDGIRISECGMRKEGRKI